MGPRAEKQKNIDLYWFIRALVKQLLESSKKYQENEYFRHELTNFIKVFDNFLKIFD